MTEHARILTEELADLLGSALQLAQGAGRGDFEISTVRRLLDGLRQTVDALDCRHHVSRRTFYSLAAFGEDRAIVSFVCGDCHADTNTILPMNAARALLLGPKP